MFLPIVAVINHLAFAFKTLNLQIAKHELQDFHCIAFAYNAWACAQVISCTTFGILKCVNLALNDVGVHRFMECRLHSDLWSAVRDCIDTLETSIEWLNFVISSFLAFSYACIFWSRYFSLLKMGLNLIRRLSLFECIHFCRFLRCFWSL